MSEKATGTIVSGRMVCGVTISPERLERAKDLAAAGFVHITGLPTFNCYADAQKASAVEVAKALAKYKITEANGADPNAIVVIGETQYIVKPGEHERGRHSYNNGKTAIVTLDGEVWLKAGGGYWGDANMNPYFRICPNGGGVFVPCSNGEQISMHLILERMADPYSNCHDHHSPIPQFRGE